MSSGEDRNGGARTAARAIRRRSLTGIGRLVTRLDSLGIRDNTLLLFVGDNGTGRGTGSMMGDRLVIGGKGMTTAAGMHVPLIASWPGKIVAGEVCPDLVDSTDFVPTPLEAAGARPPSGVKFDGRSFLPQLRGERGQPRDWIYSWYSPRQSADLTSARSGGGAEKASGRGLER